jgi:hypothetical protein
MLDERFVELQASGEKREIGFLRVPLGSTARSDAA